MWKRLGYAVTLPQGSWFAKLPPRPQIGTCRAQGRFYL